MSTYSAPKWVQNTSSSTAKTTQTRPTRGNFGLESARRQDPGASSEARADFRASSRSSARHLRSSRDIGKAAARFTRHFFPPTRPHDCSFPTCLRCSTSQTSVGLRRANGPALAALSHPHRNSQRMKVSDQHRDPWLEQLTVVLAVKPVRHANAGYTACVCVHELDQRAGRSVAYRLQACVRSCSARTPNRLPDRLFTRRCLRRSARGSRVRCAHGDDLSRHR